MPQTIVIETYEEFSRRHGGNPLGFDDWLLFSTGASVRASNVEHRREPAEDRLQLLRDRLKYQKEWCSRCEKGFNDCKADHMQHPSVEAIAELKRLQKMTLDSRAKIEAIETELQEAYDASPEGRRAKRLAEAAAERASKEAQLRAQMAQITID